MRVCKGSETGLVIEALSVQSQQRHCVRHSQRRARRIAYIHTYILLPNSAPRPRESRSQDPKTPILPSSPHYERLDEIFTGLDVRANCFFHWFSRRHCLGWEEKTTDSSALPLPITDEALYVCNTTPSDSGGRAGGPDKESLLWVGCGYHSFQTAKQGLRLLASSDE